VRHALLALACALLALACVPACAQAATAPRAWREAPADTTLTALRAARRATVRAATAVARTRGASARLTLLVIPVDFADQRLPTDWDPGPALGPPLTAPTTDGAAPSPALPPPLSLREYFRTASCGRAELDLVLAPLVRLPESTAAYSDLGFNGFTRTRKLAAAALAGTRAAGLAFARLDNDGPDGFPGTVDDDGELDGVLILHSDIGNENDADAGLIEALQYYLADAVDDRGTLARLYAVASLRSALGVWAHESAHLFGLEDRYDPFLPVTGGDLAGSGGLGVFSLMAAGARVEDGRYPALPDAYSAAQLGWRDVVIKRGLPGVGADTLRPPPLGAEVWRVWTRGETGTESFLIEARGGCDLDRVDRHLPSGLVVLHLDESLPERVQSSPDPALRHLRVRLVEADGDGRLAAGLDSGGGDDMFPGYTGRADLTPATAPSSAGYTEPTQVALTGIAPLDGGGVALTVIDATAPACALDFAFALPADGAFPLRLEATELGPPTADLTAEILVLGDPPWGAFADGALALTVPLVRDPVARSWHPAIPITWIPAGDPAGAAAATRFAIQLTATAGFAQAYTREWLWSAGPDPLDFGATWPGEWRQETLTATATSWHRWPAGSPLRADGGPVLACTGEAWPDAAAWPAVSYANGADLALVSGPLPAGTGVRLLHAIHGELAWPGAAFDGGVVEFAMADGSVAAAEPVDGYGGAIVPEARSGLHGRAAFAGEDSLAADGACIWRVDTIVAPRHVPGPVRLRLRFAADDQFRGRGWFVARLRALPASAPAGGPFPTFCLPDGTLAWQWPPDDPVTAFAVQTSLDNGATWLTAWSGPAAAELSDPASYLLPGPVVGTAAPGQRRLFRVIAQTSLGPVASRGRLLDAPRAAVEPPRLGLPYPNPARDEVRLVVELPADATGRLRACDLRGRRLREWPLTGGARLLAWDTRDERGRPLPGGVYLLHLETSRGERATCRVVILP
jgi:M6 family metalloprotease-like protein